MYWPVCTVYCTAYSDQQSKDYTRRCTGPSVLYRVLYSIYVVNSRVQSVQGDVLGRLYRVLALLYCTCTVQHICSEQQSMSSQGDVLAPLYRVLWSCVKKPGAVVVRVRLHKKVWEKNTIRGGDQQRTIKNRAEINPRNNNINQCNVLVYSRIITSKLAQYDPFCKVYVCKSNLSCCIILLYLLYCSIYKGPSLYI